MGCAPWFLLESSRLYRMLILFKVGVPPDSAERLRYTPLSRSLISRVRRPATAPVYPPLSR